MELKIMGDKENKLFERREISAEATYEGKTPTREEIKEGICKKLSLSPETFDIIRIDQEYGLQSSKIVAYSYKSKEAMTKFMKKVKEKKAKPNAGGTSGASAVPAPEKK